MKNKSYLLRMTAEEKRKIEKRARESGMSMAGYLRYLSTLDIEASLSEKAKREVRTDAKRR